MTEHEIVIRVKIETERADVPKVNVTMGDVKNALAARAAREAAANDKPWECVAVETWFFGHDYRVLWIAAFKNRKGEVVIRRAENPAGSALWRTGQKYAL